MLPDQSLKVALAPDDIQSCRDLLRTGSRTFYAASFLLPRRVRHPATALYAFCRLADDAVDEAGASGDVLEQLATRLAYAYEGKPLPIAADRAFAVTVRRFAIPRDVPAALIEGFAWDAEGRRYETFEDLEDYAARVAGTVGVMMALLMGARDPERLARACDLGIGMQLSNIARDVGEDARRGRIYLPLSWMREAGIDPTAFLANPTYSPELGAVVARLLDAAESYYASAEAGIARLPADCRPGIRAARRLYAAIGHQVRNNSYDSVSQRAVVPAKRKLSLLAGTIFDGRPRAVVTTGVPICKPAAFIAAAAEGGPSVREAACPARVRWWDLYAGWVWAIDLFLRLEGETQDSRSMWRPSTRFERAG